MNKQKIKTAFKTGAAMTVTAVVSVAVVLLIHESRKTKNGWDGYYVNPDQLQQMIDAPETIVVFDDQRVLVGSSASSEL